MNKSTIIPAILAADKTEFQLRLEKLVGLVNQIQIDFTDGTLTPSKTISLSEAIQLAEGFKMDLHLMVNDPLQYRDDFRTITGTIIWHLEAPVDHRLIIKRIRSQNKSVGIAINPNTPIANLKPYPDLIEEVLVMTVKPGASGQPIIPEALPKISQIKKIHPRLTVGVDGGINPENISEVATHQPDKINVGSGLFRNGKVEENLRKMQEALTGS